MNSERMYEISEENLNKALAILSDIPWKFANGVISILQISTKEVVKAVEKPLETQID